MHTFARVLVAFLIGILVSTGHGAETPPVTASKRQEAAQRRYAEQLVADSNQALQAMSGLEEAVNMRADLAQAKAVLVFPQAVRAGFVLGGAGGNGVLLVREPVSGQWIGPAFFSLGSASLGLQAGVSAAQMVIVVRSQKALDSLYDGKFTVGADAAATIGAGCNERGANWNADLMVYARAKGAFLGLTVDGSVLQVRNRLNHAYYGRVVTPIQILVENSVSNPQASPLLGTLNTYPR